MALPPPETGRPALPSAGHRTAIPPVRLARLASPVSVFAVTFAVAAWSFGTGTALAQSQTQGQAVAAGTAGVPTAGTASAPPLALDYTVLLGGLPMMTARLDLDLGGGGRWTAALDARPVPLIGRLFQGTVAVQAAGGRAPGGITPGRYGVRIVMPQREEHTRIAYQPGPRAGGGWLPRRVQPRPQETADPALAGALDPVSAVAQLIDSVAAAGRCPETLALYDGWRRFDIAFDSKPVEAVPVSPGAAYRGPGLACGYQVDTAANSPADGYLAFLTQGTVWLAAPVAGGPAVPVVADAGRGVAALRLLLTGVERLDEVPATAPAGSVETLDPDASAQDNGAPNTELGAPPVD